MIEFLDNLISFAFLLVAVTGSLVAIFGCALVLALLAGFSWRLIRDIAAKGLGR